MRPLSATSGFHENSRSGTACTGGTVQNTGYCWNAKTWFV
jgi:hypothetical protein